MVYRCLLSTEDMFPNLATEAEMVKTAWGQVNRETGLTPLRLTPDIAKIVSGHQLSGLILTAIKIKACGSQACCYDLVDLQRKTGSVVRCLLLVLIVPLFKAEDVGVRT